jgi:DNA-binding transcriptional ArsR family regulator
MDSAIDLDAIIKALAHRRRRYALYYLRAENTGELEEIARRIAAWESGIDPAGVSDEQLRPVLVDLHHVHLEVFRDAACIEYDERSSVIRYRNPPSPLSELLDVIASVEHPDEE